MQRKRKKQNCQNADDTQTEELLDMASAIDPRFKLKYVNKDRVEAVKISLKTEMTSVFTVMKVIIIGCVCHVYNIIVFGPYTVLV